MTLAFYFMMVIMAYLADCVRARSHEKREDKKQGMHSTKNPAAFNTVRALDALDFYNKLLPIEAGGLVKPED